MTLPYDMGQRLRMTASRRCKAWDNSRYSRLNCFNSSREYQVETSASTALLSDEEQYAIMLALASANRTRFLLLLVEVDDCLDFVVSSTT